MGSGFLGLLVLFLPWDGVIGVMEGFCTVLFALFSDTYLLYAAIYVNALDCFILHLGVLF